MLSPVIACLPLAPVVIGLIRAIFLAKAWSFTLPIGLATGLPSPWECDRQQRLCARAKMPVMTVETLDGREFPVEHVLSLVRGDSADRVRELLGDPLEVTANEDGSEDWRYFVRARKPRWLHVAHVQFEMGDEIVRSEAVIRLKNGRVAMIGRFEPGTRE